MQLPVEGHSALYVKQGSSQYYNNWLDAILSCIRGKVAFFLFVLCIA